VGRVKYDNDKDWKWLATQDLGQYAGCWIAIFDQAIIASGKDLNEVVKCVNAKNINKEEPIYLRVPEGYISLYELNSPCSVVELFGNGLVDG